ncbi:hypothetical protein B4589_012700 [Halolamina sp. CBA1230]|uniref:DUF6149 family protein n=1 Tax=Halolamina sp. CBA1230 TaxID=1853690 RepID=UPI0009A1BFF6|nr:DUF6149 family protein [Halolamina sp. CBA1230]QKY21191.1 hypothetical protein B4589_012700 [Halolamina sp. CBA1230]
MRLHQSWRNYAAQVLLELDIPLVTDWVRSWLVDLHTDFFVEHSERDAEARRPLFEALFDATIDVYREALREGYPEAQAREITHIQGSWTFIQQGWGELVEFPPEEADAYYERYEDFFDRHGCSPENPLGEFAPPSGLPDTPETPGRLNGDYPFAVPNLTDGVYVVDEKTEVRLACGVDAEDIDFSADD